jgi:5-methyltetrahydropteroyltriglutamate--homocysteine methyltransferase
MPYLRAHVVGSMLRPPELLRSAVSLRQGQMDLAKFRQIEDRAVDEAIAIQERAGIDLITDAEQRRLAFGDVFGQSVTGIEPVAPRAAGDGPRWRSWNGSAKWPMRC